MGTRALTSPFGPNYAEMARGEIPRTTDVDSRSTVVALNVYMVPLTMRRGLSSIAKPIF